LWFRKHNISVIVSADDTVQEQISFGDITEFNKEQSNMVSILTPTYKRFKFIPRLVECIIEQDTKSKLEWCILDDSPEPLSLEQRTQLWGKLKNVSVFYVWMPSKIPIGNKRNILSCMARGKYLINFDDDDFHSPSRIKHSIMKMEQKKASLVGCTRCLLYHDEIIYQVKGFGGYHSTGGLMAYTREYAVNHRFGEDKPHAEEGEFTNMFKNELIQLDPLKCILIMSHAENTFDKTAYIKLNVGKTLDKTNIKIQHYSKSKKLRRLFAQVV